MPNDLANLQEVEKQMTGTIAALKEVATSQNPFLAEFAVDLIEAQTDLLLKTHRLITLASPS